jgi:hypothetical protein
VAELLSQTKTLQDLIRTALLGGNNAIPHNFHDYESLVVATIDAVIGVLTAELWPPKSPSPVLIIHDTELQQRCSDLLSALGDYDRVIREATTVLEDRIRRRPPFDVLASLIPQTADQSGDNLVNKLSAPDNPILSISNDRARRIAFHRMLLGVVSYLRNHYYHQLDTSTRWSWAWFTVSLIDHLLADIDSCIVQTT